MNGIKNAGIQELNVLQKKVLGVKDSQKKIIIKSPTGSGKTLAFLLNVLQRTKPGKGFQLLIISPTRELAIQIEKNLRSLSLGLNTALVYGERPASIDRKHLHSLY